MCPLRQPHELCVFNFLRCVQLLVPPLAAPLEGVGAEDVDGVDMDGVEVGGGQGGRRRNRGSCFGGKWSSHCDLNLRGCIQEASGLPSLSVVQPALPNYHPRSMKKWGRGGICSQKRGARSQYPDHVLVGLGVEVGIASPISKAHP